MLLSKQHIKESLFNPAVIMPGENLFQLPEKVLQFGTGVLLRGLPDYFIDKANKQGVFNGRIVVVKSTSVGGIDAFAHQDGLYTVCVRGLEGDTKIEENIINASISRVLSANAEWEKILECASDPAMEIVISNTTEAGIALTNDNIHNTPPDSFPGKLLAFLYRRYKHFKGDQEKGMIIIPTELLIDNGTILKNILVELANQNKLGDGFIEWMTEHNQFCNSLVDRIVPGKMADETHKKMEKELGYEDSLMIMSELYRLWAIESRHSSVYEKLSFGNVDEGVIITSDIGMYRELKLRLLNGSHTFSCGLAHLCGFVTVNEAMEHRDFRRFLTQLILQEIVPAIVGGDITTDMATDFANKVMDRYRNPHIEHRWLNIAMQYSLKMKSRNIPLIRSYYQRFGIIPDYMAFGFAAFLLFMKAIKQPDDRYAGNSNGKSYFISDNNASLFSERWSNLHPDEMVKAILADEQLWGADLSSLSGFAKAVTENLHLLETNGTMQTLKNRVSTKAV